MLVRRALVIAALAAVAWLPDPSAGVRPTCVSACVAATDRCAERCEARTRGSFRHCRISCARRSFVACFLGCEETGEAIVEDPFADAAVVDPDDC